MALPSARRSLLRRAVVAAAVPFVGCSGGGDSERRPDWVTSADLAVYNETDSAQRLAVALYELHRTPDSGAGHRPVTDMPSPTRRPLYHREFRVPAGDDVWLRRVLQKRETNTPSRLVVRLHGGGAAVYEFHAQYASGLTAVVVDINSRDEVRFSSAVV